NPELAEKHIEQEERRSAFYSNVACSLIESNHNDKKHIQTFNTLNNGAIPSLPNDAVIEVNCVITKHGPNPVSVGELLNAVKGYIYQMKAFEELVIQAAVSGDYHDAYLSFTMTPIIGDDMAAKVMLDELLEAHNAYLLQFYSKQVEE